MKMKAHLATLLVLCVAGSMWDFHRDYMARFTRSGSQRLQEAVTCPEYACDALPTGECVAYSATSGNYQVQSCGAGQFCPVALDMQADASCLPLEPSSGSSGNPGSTCATNSDCSGLAQNCTKGICYGFPLGHSCSDQPDCGVGLMCENIEENGTCEPQIAGGKQCETWVYDENCINGYVCINESCAEMFSLPIGAIVSSDYGAEACSTGFYEAFPGFPQRGYCAAAPTSPASMMPIPCQAGSLCYSADGRWSTPCECGINPTGAAYCPVFPGDDLYQHFLALFKEYMVQSNPASCHELDFGNEPCGAPAALFSSLNLAKVTVDLQVAIQGNTQCIKQTFTEAYWSAVSSMEDLAIE